MAIDILSILLNIVSILSGTDIHFTENQSLNKIIYQQLNNWYTSCASKIKWDNILEIRKIMKKHSENILSTKHGFYPIIQQLLEKGKLTLKFQMKL